MSTNPVRRFFEAIGAPIIAFVEHLGSAVTLAGSTGFWGIRPPYRVVLFINQMQFIGVGSLFIVLLVGAFTGMVFALQTVAAFGRFNAEALVGGAVALALTRELAPVLAAMMVTARAGSAMAAELGTMRVTEQVDALYTMAVNPIQYLVVPRVVASTIMLPILTMLFNTIGIVGAYLVAVQLMGVDSGAFIQNIERYVVPWDIISGLIKSAVFGYLLALISCHMGISASGGAKGVGIATTRAVVVSAITIFIADYILTKFMF